MIVRYNLYPSASINGQPAPGYSSGEAVAVMEQLAAERQDLTQAVTLLSQALKEVAAFVRAPFVEVREEEGRIRPRCIDTVTASVRS